MEPLPEENENLYKFYFDIDIEYVCQCGWAGKYPYYDDRDGLLCPMCHLPLNEQ